ncbi:unnamed protein product [Mytilus coruscus]|uniref:Uncharacterized protein n=1 Tax=Mytilus coruscus TaxID=42192 RepID=A0A6J8BZS1_MYTCO|nr:unnamed protein product [Mytilus coruscus]
MLGSGCVFSFDSKPLFEGSTPRSLLDRIRRERSLLFSSGSGKSNSPKNLPRNQKKSKGKTWTGTFICLADKSQGRVPSVSEKEVLIRAQLGSKRIQFCLEDKEEDVLAKLSENETGFHQLQDIGGFELLRCRQNCRQLEIVDCPWTVRDLKATLGSQSKIYLRPIQVNLSTQSTVQTTHIEKKEACKSCGDSFSIHELRKHIKLCHEKDLSNESDSELYNMIHILLKQMSKKLMKSTVKRFQTISWKIWNKLSHLTITVDLL